MLFIHFTPNKSVSDIKRNGIRPVHSKVFLFPLLHNQKTLVNHWNNPAWWQPGSPQHDKSMAKVIVRLPSTTRVYFEDWLGATTKAKGRELFPLFSVAAVGRLLGGEIPNPFANCSSKGWAPRDVELLGQWAQWWWKGTGDIVKSSANARLFDAWLKDRLQEWRIPANNKRTSTVGSLWGSVIVYPNHVPRKWIVKIFDRSNTDQRSRAYARKQKAQSRESA